MTRVAPRVADDSWSVYALLALFDLSARLAVPISLLALAHGSADLAVIAAAVVSALALVRAVVSGRAMEGAILSLWTRLVAAAKSMSLADLRNRPEVQSVAILLEATRETSAYRANVVPRLVADALGFAVLAVAIVIRLDAAWILLGVGALALAGTFVALGQRRLRTAQDAAWLSFGHVARDFEVLLEAAAELRAHGRQAAFARGVLGQVGEMAAAQLKVNTMRALVGLFPLGIALLAAATPLRAGVSAFTKSASVVSLVETGILGATAMALAIGLIRGLQSVQLSRPHRRTLRSFLESASLQSSSATPSAETRNVPDLQSLDIVFDDATVQHPGAKHATPSAFGCQWSPGRGLALVGDNGTGKSSLVHAMLGLSPLHRGTIRFGDVPLAQVDWESFRDRVAYVPQRPFMAPSQTVAWHLRLAQPASDDAELREVLKKVDLLHTLIDRAPGSPLDVPVGELSGGERARLMFARVFLGSPELCIVDEPEAGLDQAGRKHLRTLLEELSHHCRVVLVAHDTTIIPEGFLTARCERGQLSKLVAA
ncbi:ATP-binding cassette domain-containing protein [Endomicrobium sp. AH-315-J14]|nr:ATP-binding cassette domain-containing protein [Endomicrobium sp. AH-315-J14]